MSWYWNSYSSGSRKPRFDLTRTQDQLKAQAQDQDQNQRNVFREIGNVNITIDNENIAVAVLAILAALLGDLDSADVQTMLDRYLPARVE